MNGSEVGVLKPHQKRKLNEAIAQCSSCLATLDYLKKLGHDDSELRGQAEYIQSLAEGALAVDAELKSE